MSKSLKFQIIEDARALIADQRHWCRGELARDEDGLSADATDPRAFKWCGLGALISAAYELTHDHQRAYDLAISALRPRYGSATLVYINETRGHAAVLTLLDDALAMMRARNLIALRSGRRTLGIF